MAVTRREKLAHVISSFGGRSAPAVRHAIEDTIARMNIDAFSDEAVEAIAARIIDGMKFSAKLARQNRLLMQSKE